MRRSPAPRTRRESPRKYRCYRQKSFSRTEKRKAIAFREHIVVKFGRTGERSHKRICKYSKKNRGQSVLGGYKARETIDKGIKAMMPRFQKLLIALHHNNAEKLRDTLAQYDAIAKRILNLPTESPSQKRLQKAIHQSAVNFLHLNMLPLKALPKLLHKWGQNGRSASNYIENGKSNGAVIRSASSDASSVGDEKEKQLKEQIMVLEEQKFLVDEMMKDANKRRRFGEVAAFGQSVEELEGGIGRLTELVEQL
ncbi:carboxypeptidase Y-deficient [Rhizina undulata]